MVIAMLKARYLVALTSVVLLGACTQKVKDLNATLQAAFIGPESNQVSQQLVENTPYASLFAQQDSDPQALLVLGWVEPGLYHQQFKWLSADNEILVTEAGRIVKTVNFQYGDLLRLTATSPDPLALNLLKPSTPKKWQYTLDWQPGYHIGYQAESQFILGQAENVTMPTQTKLLIPVTEVVTVKALSLSYQNTFWLNPQTGLVEMAEQHLFPGSKIFKTAIGKAYSAGASS